MSTPARELVPGHQGWSLDTQFVSTSASAPAQTGFLRLRGAIDLAAAPGLRDAVRRAVDEGAGDLTLDLSGVSFLDGTGVDALSWCREHVEASGSRLRLGQVSREAARVLTMTGFPQVNAELDDPVSGGSIVSIDVARHPPRRL